MFDTVLFLGFPLSDAYQRELASLSVAQRELFIQSDGYSQVSPYLQQIEKEGILYLGKFLGASIEMNALDFSYLHILSLLKKLVPHFSYEKHPLLLLSLPAEICSPHSL